MKGSVARKKAELQSRGIRIPQEFINELEAKYNAPAIRTGRIVLLLRSSENEGELVSVFIVNGKRAALSPFQMVKNCSDQYEIWTGNEKYTTCSFLPRPKFYDNLTVSGIPMYKLAVIVGPGHMRSVVNQRCYYYRIGKQCKFCAVQHWWDANIEKSPMEIAEVIQAGVKEGVVQHVSLTTATLNTSGKGLENLVKTAKLIHNTIKIPIMLEFEPIDDFVLLEQLLYEAKEAGVTTISCNIECFDNDLRKKVMPAKGMIPVEIYIKTWKKCVDIFGKNDVFTVAVAGIGEADNSIIKGIGMAAAHSVMTFLVPHSPAIGAVFSDMDPPSAERMIALYEQAVTIYEKHGLNLFASHAGCVRGGGFSAIKDIARYGA